MMSLKLSKFIGSGLLLVTMGFTGCQPPANTDTGTANQSQSVSQTANAAIVPDATVPEDDKQAMLAAKDSLFQQLSQALMSAMENGGPAAAIQVCQKKAPELAAAVSADHGLMIGRTGVRLRNPENVAPQWARELTSEKLDSPRFVKLSNGDSAALLPIKLQAQCLICHGPVEQMMPEVTTELAKFYPKDRATGFQEGELRGWFWVEKPSNM